MSEINFGLLQPVDVGALTQQGFATGVALVNHVQTQNALKGYLANPDNPQAYSALASFDPATAQSLLQQRRETQQLAATQAQLTRRQQAGTQAAGGDVQGGMATALKGGDTEFADALSKLDETQKKQLADMYKGAAPFAYQALKLPYEQRKAYVQQIAPQLQAAGWDAGKIAGFDPTDANLGSIVQGSMTLDQAMGRDKIDYREVLPGARLVPFDATGRPVTHDTGGAAPASTAAPQASGSSLQYTVTPGAKQTSGLRTPQHNHDVGGVPNSYHTRLGADGQPLAHDFVPPAGMSMAQFAADMKARNPHLDVLNEGDHVHIEPSGHVASNEAVVRQHAQEAIAAGADPAQVKARAAAMGVAL